MKTMLNPEETAKIRRLKAKIFLKNSTPAFIVTLSNSYHFCRIKEVEEDYILVYDFIGPKEGTESKVYYLDIFKFEEYRDQEQ